MQSYLAGDLPRDEYLPDRRRKAQLVRQLLSLASDHSIFEIGSGEGLVAAALAPHVKRLVCVDVSASFLAKAHTTCQGLGNVEFCLSGGYLDDLPSASYDRGYSWNVFVHLDAYQVFHYLRAVARVLLPGALFAFNFVSVGDQTIRHFRVFADAYPSASPQQLPGFLRWYEPELMTAIASEAGLSTVAASGAGGGHVLAVRRCQPRTHVRHGTG
jgi:cyclopropane fatty-acyl-phospholipid synthase-like methyltransferase